MWVLLKMAGSHGGGGGVRTFFTSVGRDWLHDRQQTLPDVSNAGQAGKKEVEDTIIPRLQKALIPFG